MRPVRHLIHPGIGGINVSEPVQSNKLSHSYVSPPHRTWFLSAIEASPFTTVTLLATSFPLTPSTSFRTTFCLRATILDKSNDTSGTLTAYLDAWRALSYVFAEYNKVLVGIHPHSGTLRQDFVFQKYNAQTGFPGCFRSRISGRPSADDGNLIFHSSCIYRFLHARYNKKFRKRAW